MPYGDKPFGIRDIKITNIAGTTQVDLPVGQVLTFGERVKSGELSGDDKTQSVVAFADAVEWDLEAGGISLEAYALMTGRTATEAGTTPSQTNTLSGSGAEAFPYIKIYGKALGDGTDDIHVKIWKAKVTGGIEGSFKDGEFWVTKCSGVAIDDGSNGIWDFVQNETATALAGS
jgi:hypothetical protein